MNQEINPPSNSGTLQYEQKTGRSYDTRATGETHFLGGLLHFQVLAAMGAGFRITGVGLAAIKTAGPIGWRRRPSWGKSGFPSFLPVEKVEGEEDDQEEEYANCPEKALPEGVPMLLGIEKHPHGQDQRKHIKEDEKETHPGFSQKQQSAFSRHQTILMLSEKVFWSVTPAKAGV